MGQNQCEGKEGEKRYADDFREDLQGLLTT